MMTNLFKYTLLIFLLSFSACSSEDYVAPTIPNGQPQPGDALEITVSAGDFVTDGAPDTRATDNGNETTFENGDRVGIIILDKRNVPIYNNIPYKYNGGKWVFDSNNGEGKGACYYDPEATTYIVYYPYSQTADGVTNENDLKSKFAPNFDQSTKENYRASDLMYCKTTSETPFKRLEAKLKHAYTSFSFAPTAYRLDDGKNTRCNIKVSDVSLTIGDNIYIPYQMADGSLRSILPASFTTGNIRCFYVFGGKNCGYTITIQNAVISNTCYTFAPEIINKTYNLQDAKVGDFYCKRSSDNKGYLIPSEVYSLSNDINCLGVVLKVGKDNDGDWIDDCIYTTKEGGAMNTINGYVLALYDANNAYTTLWSYDGIWVGTDVQSKVGFWGYKNTKAIKEKAVSIGRTLLRAFPAAYHSSDGYEINYASPSNSSGWFFPSAGQCRYWYQNKEAILVSLQKIGRSFQGRYWTSSESEEYIMNGSSAYYLNIDSGSSYSNSKDCRGSSGAYWPKVRSMLAF